jgi:ligand-binding sensor domain-containing protein
LSRHPISELPLASPYIQAVFSGFDGKIWIASSQDKELGGYLSIGEDGIHAYGKYNTDMPCYHVWALAQDSQLNMWVGTCIGLLKTGPSGSEIYNSPSTGLSGYTKTICPVGDGVWIGTQYGVSRYADGVWSVLSPGEAGLNLAWTEMIKTDSQGRVWIACSAGVCCYANGEFTAYPEASAAKDLAFGEEGDLWVARGQISHLRDGQWQHYNASNSGLTANLVRSVAIDHHQMLWAGTSQNDGKLYCFDGMNWNNFNAQNSPLSSEAIKTIYVDEDNNKWIGAKSLYLYNEAGLQVSNPEEIVNPVYSCVNYPNPFAESTTIRYEKRTASPLSIRIYNVKGQLVWSESGIPSSKGEIHWDGKDKHGRNCATGLYLIQLHDQDGSSIHKALKLR